jgi:hypothetical protein
MWTFQDRLAANSNSVVICGSRAAAWQTVLQGLRDLIAGLGRIFGLSPHKLRHFLEATHPHGRALPISLEHLNAVHVTPIVTVK